MSAKKANAGKGPDTTQPKAKSRPKHLFTIWEKGADGIWSQSHKSPMSSLDCKEIIDRAQQQRPGVSFVLLAEGEQLVQDGLDYKIVLKSGGGHG